MDTQATTAWTAAEFSRYGSDPMAFFENLIIPTADGPKRWGSCMFDFQREWLSDLSAVLLASAKGEKAEHRRWFFEGPKGVAKSSIIGAGTAWKVAFDRQPKLIQIGAVDKDNAGESLKTIRDFVYLNPAMNDHVSVQAWKLVGKLSGSTAEWCASDLMGSAGARPSWLWIDEFCHIEREEFVSNLLDNANKIANSVVAVFTNAGWTNSYQWDWRNGWVQAGWVLRGRYEPSPAMDAADLAESAHRNSPSRHRRLHYTEWQSGSGSGLNHASVDASDVLPGPVDRPQNDRVYVAGLDLGVKKDHSSLVVLECDGHTRKVRLARCFSWAPIAGQVDLIAVRETVALCNRIYGLRSVWYDPHQALLMAQELQKEGVNMQEMAFVGANLNRMASAMVEAFQSGRIELYHDEQLIADLKRLAIVERSFGMKLEAPADTTRGHCDRAFAMATCLPKALDLANQQTGEIVLDHFIDGRFFGPGSGFGGSTGLFGSRGITGDMSPRGNSFGMGRGLPGFGGGGFGR